MRRENTPRDATRRLAVFVGGGIEALAFVEPILGERAYDVEFVDEQPYATIAALKPDIVVVCLDLQSTQGFQLLTMLRLDPQTAEIPVLSYVSETDAAGDDLANVDHSALRLPTAAVRGVQRH